MLMKNVSPHLHLATFSECPEPQGSGQNTFFVCVR